MYQSTSPSSRCVGYIYRYHQSCNMQVKTIIITTIMLITLSCRNSELKDYETVLSEIIVEKLHQTKYRIIEYEYKYGRDRKIFSLLDTLINDLKTFNSIVSCKEGIIDYINNIDTAYTNEFEREAYKDVFILRDNLLKNDKSNVQNLIYLNRLIDVFAMEESLSILVHPKYQIQPFFKDTVYLNKGSSLKLPLALYLEYEGDSLLPNYIEHNINFQSQFFEFSTSNRNYGEVYKEYLKMKIQNEVTGETYTIKDSLTIKIEDR